MGAASSSRSRRRQLQATAWKSVDRSELQPSGGGEDDRGQLAECLAFISDMALTGDSDVGPHRAEVGGPPTAPPPGQQPTGAALHNDNEVEGEATGDPVEEEAVPEPPTNLSGGRARWLRHRMERRRLQRQRSAPGGTSTHHPGPPVDDTVSSHIQMLNSLDSQDDDSEDWAEMRSWLVWCLRDKLGDADVLAEDPTRRHSPRSASPRRTVSTTSRGSRGQLVRQQAVHERSPRIGVVDCSGPTPPGGSASPMGRVMLGGASLDSQGCEAGSTAGRLTVGASCSGQSSFESYG